MYRVSVLFYTDTTPTGITIQDFDGLTRQDCIDQLIEKINSLESADTHGERTLKITIKSEVYTKG